MRRKAMQNERNRKDREWESKEESWNVEGFYANVEEMWTLFFSWLGFGFWEGLFSLNQVFWKEVWKMRWCKRIDRFKDIATIWALQTPTTFPLQYSRMLKFRHSLYQIFHFYVAAHTQKMVTAIKHSFILFTSLAFILNLVHLII